MKTYTIKWDDNVVVVRFFNSKEAWKWIAAFIPSRATISVTTGE